ncbi:hypothetical protein D3C79_511610 [compost metagenome]
MGSSHFPTASRAIRANSPLREAQAISASRALPCTSGLASMGIITSSGTTARSWNSKMLTPSWARRVCSCFSSPSCLITTAVEESARVPETTSAWGRVSPHHHPSQKNSEVVNSTCRPPTPSTSLRMESRRGSENSSPRENIRKTMPSSPMVCMIACPVTMAAPWGPSSMPTNR